MTMDPPIGYGGLAQHTCAQSQPPYQRAGSRHSRGRCTMTRLLHLATLLAAWATTAGLALAAAWLALLATVWAAG